MVKQEDITVVKIYAPNMAAPKYIEQVLRDIKEDTDSNTILVGGFLIKVTSVDIYSRKSTKNSGFEWHLRPDGPSRYIQCIPSKTVEFISSTQGTFPRIDYVRSQNTSQ